MNYLEYKGYTGTIEYSHEDNLLYGQVLGIRSLISYEGEIGRALEEDFKASVDTYLEDCKANHKAPEKPFKGSFNIRIPANLHQEAALMAMEAKTSLNSFIAEAIRLRVQRS